MVPRMSESERPLFELSAIADVLAPSAPARWGDRAVYALRRIHREKKKTFSSLHAVPLAGGAPVRLTRGDFLDREPRVDPAGRFLIFTSNRSGSEQLYRLDEGGGEPRLLTAFPRGSLAEAAISPDGSTIAVLFTPAAPAPSDALPLAADLARGKPFDPLPDTFAGATDEEPAPLPPAEEPVARVIVRVRNREDGIGFFTGRAHVWLVSAETGAARRLTRGERDFASPAWLPSGSALIACASALGPGDPDFDPTRNDLVRIDAASGAVSSLPKPDGLAFAPSVSPSGDHVAYVLLPGGDANFRENFGACVTSLGGSPHPASSHPASAAGEPWALLTRDLDRTVFDVILDDLVGGAFAPAAPIWSGDGKTLTLVVSDRGSVRLYEQPADRAGGGRFLTAEERSVSAPEALGGGAFAAIAGSRGEFAEIVRVERDGRVTPLTSHNAKLAARLRPRAPERVDLVRDGVTISGYYLAPRGGGDGRAVLFIHGGPHAAFGERLYFQMQHFADHGWAVLYTNPRGSQSYGLAYASAIDFHWGDPDAGDQLAFVDWLAARPEVDPKRIAVAGGSYGGFMTLLLCATSDRFKAAVAQRGLFNFLTDTTSSDFGHCAPAFFFGGALPFEDPHRYLEKSPIRLVRNVKAPMLVVQSEHDLRCGNEQSYELFNELKRAGVPTALVLFPEESHGVSRIGRIDRRAEQLRQMRAWLDAWI
jgi:dipeptidyl aminopeptidase/acylaminoacyl peptidase